MLVVSANYQRYGDQLRDFEQAPNVRGMAEPADGISGDCRSVFSILVRVVDYRRIAARVHPDDCRHVLRCDGYPRRQQAHIPVCRAVAVREVVVNHVVDNSALEGLGVLHVALLEEERRIARAADGVRTAQVAGRN